ncbi:MAG: hypothetical protein ACFCU1_05820 [Sumerlaeia bacterium]
MLQSIDSSSASVIEDGKTIEARAILIEIPQAETNTTVYVSAPVCHYYFQAPTTTESLSSDEVIMLQDELLAENQISTPSRDDMFLFDPDDATPIKIDLGTKGEILCRNLYWSEAAKSFISGGFFSQTLPFEGDTMKITGTGFIANEDFSSVQYTKPTETIFSSTKETP